MYQSLSQTIGKIEKQALRIKNKVTDKHHKAKKVGTVVTPAQEVKPTPTGARIINARRYAVKPMTSEEAAMRLDGEADHFLVFRNADDERISVIYRRKDGNFGLIQP